MFKSALVTLGIVLLGASSLSAEPTSLFGIDFYDEPPVVRKKLAEKFSEQISECEETAPGWFVCWDEKNAVLAYESHRSFQFDCKLFNGCNKINLVSEHLMKRWKILFKGCSTDDRAYCYENKDISVKLEEQVLFITLKNDGGINFD